MENYSVLNSEELWSIPGIFILHLGTCDIKKSKRKRENYLGSQKGIILSLL